MKSSSFIDELLAEQRQLTAVERFAQRPGGAKPALARYYEDLIPLELPRPGEQYAFRVDLDACSGCKACVSACHSLNGLDEEETWRSVGSLHGGTSLQPYQQTVTTACHHCVEPACLEGCPVLAYEKDEVTGIVRHLDDQCIGCQYCVLKCPYDVPKYSAKRGIVRKCDMCHSRLASNEAPACVQACPSGAISIEIVSRAKVAADCADPERRLLPGVFPSNYAQPATSYISRNPFPDNCQPADTGRLRLEPAHWPLVWMLILTQAAAGLFLVTSLAAVNQPRTFTLTALPLSISGFALLVAGLAVSVFHLGRPLGAWRVFLGLRRSWMSREILAFCLFALFAGAVVLASWFRQTNWTAALATTAAVFGLVSVYCSAMIYVDTRREAWKAAPTFLRFFTTALLLGSAAAATLFTFLDLIQPMEALRTASISAAWTTLIIRSGVFLFELRKLCNRPGKGTDSAQTTKSASLPRQLHSVPGHVERVFMARILLLFLSSLFGLTAITIGNPVSAWAAAASLVLTFGSQVIERYCFFVFASAPKMPGGFSE